MAKRVAKFEKVSFEQFKKDWEDTYNNPNLLTDESINDAYSVVLPERATKFSAGYDFYSPLDFSLEPGESIKIPTGIRCGINTDYVLMLYVRSNVGFKYKVVLANGTGIIDSDYYSSDNEGHIFIKLVNNGNVHFYVKKGEAICQGVFLEYGITEDDCVETTRNGGLGSTNAIDESSTEGVTNE
jgi:dUTP pyrophosphatase